LVIFKKFLKSFYDGTVPSYIISTSNDLAKNNKNHEKRIFVDGANILPRFTYNTKSQCELITEYLKIFLKTLKDMKGFENLINLGEMRRIFYLEQLLKGEDVSAIPRSDDLNSPGFIRFDLNELED